MSQKADEAYGAGYDDGLTGAPKYKSWPKGVFQRQYDEGYSDGESERQRRLLVVNKV